MKEMIRMNKEEYKKITDEIQGGSSELCRFLRGFIGSYAGEAFMNHSIVEIRRCSDLAQRDEIKEAINYFISHLICSYRSFKEYDESIKINKEVK